MLSLDNSLCANLSALTTDSQHTHHREEEINHNQRNEFEDIEVFKERSVSFYRA